MKFEDLCEALGPGSRAIIDALARHAESGTGRVVVECYAEVDGKPVDGLGSLLIGFQRDIRRAISGILLSSAVSNGCITLDELEALARGNGGDA